MSGILSVPRSEELLLSFRGSLAERVEVRTYTRDCAFSSTVLSAANGRATTKHIADAKQPFGLKASLNAELAQIRKYILP